MANAYVSRTLHTLQATHTHYLTFNLRPVLPHTTTDHKEGEQLEDRRNVGENSCNSGDGTDQTGPILDVYDDDDEPYTRS